MARIRTVKPEFWKHETLSRLPESTHMLAASLLNYADDEGYFNANVHLIKAECCPLREPSVSIHDSLTLLSIVNFIRVGESNDCRIFGQILTFCDHQRINRPTISKIKDIPITWRNSPTTHPLLTEGSHPEGKGKEQGKEGNGSGSFVDIRSLLYGHCADWMAFNNGHDRKPYRAQIGKWLKTIPEADLIAAFLTAEKANPQGDRAAYIAAILKPKGRKAPQI